MTFGMMLVASVGEIKCLEHVHEHFTHPQFFSLGIQHLRETKWEIQGGMRDGSQDPLLASLFGHLRQQKRTSRTRNLCQQHLPRL